MKKLFLLAAIAATGFAAAPVAQAEFAPAANTPYLLKLNGTENYLNMAQPAQKDNSDNASIITESSPVVFCAGTKWTANDGKWAIRSAETMKYLKPGPNNWTTSVSSDTPYYWTVTETEEGYLHIAKNNNSDHNIGAQIAWPSYAFDDNSASGTANIDWLLEASDFEYTVPENEIPFIEQGKAFAIKHVGSGLYLDIANPGSEHGNPCPVVAAAPTPIYLTVNQENLNQFFIHTGGDEPKFAKANGWAAYVGTDPYFWTLTETEVEGVDNVVVTIAGGNKGLGAASYVAGQNCYANKPDNGPLEKWELVEYKEPRPVTIHMPGPDGTVIDSEMSVMDGDDVLALIPFSPLFFATGVEGGNSIVSASNTEFTVQGTWMLNRAMRMKLRPVDENKTYIKYNGTTLVCNDSENIDALQPENLWYFKYVSTDEQGRIHVTVHTFAAPDNYGLTGSTTNNSAVSLTASPTEFVIANNDAAQNTYNGFTLLHSGGEIYVSNLQDNSDVTMYANNMSPRDYNSLFRLYELTESDYAATSWTYNGEDVAIDAEKLQAAQAANGGAAEIREVFGNVIEGDFFASMGRERYKQLTGVAYTEGAVSVPGYVSPSNELVAALREALVSEDGSAVAAAVAAIDAATPGYSYETTEGAIYTLRSNEINVRGYLRNLDGMMTNTKSPSDNTFDAENTDFHFVFVTVDGVKYLYNIGAGKFMNAFGEKTDSDYEAVRNAADYTWRFSDVPTQIRELRLFTANIAHSFTISAGLTPTNNSSFAEGVAHEGGLSMTNSCTRPVLVTMGITHRTDGNGLIADYVGMMSADELAAVVAQATEALNGVSTQVNAIPEITEESHIVNHYSVLAAAAINAATAADHQHYLMETGERQAPVAGTAYTLVNEKGNAWFVTSDGGVTTNHVSKMNADNEAHFQWIVTLNEPAVTEPEETETENEVAAQADSAAPTYTFSHTHNGEKINLAIDGVTDHELGTDTLGKVNIAGTNYVMASTQGDATTAISEIGVDSPAANVYYDLQGRRVVAPAKGGIYVTGNGKKVIF